MKKVKAYGALAAVVLLAVAGGAMAQGAGPGGSGRIYDPKTVETVSGTVVRVETFQGGGRGAGGHGVHLVLKTEKEEVAVHLGPSWYLDTQPLKIRAQDTIEVRGSRVTVDGKGAIIAADVKRGDQSLHLRDTNGIPVWSGRKWKQ